MLPKKAIIEYQSIYKDHFGVTITFDQATKLANQLMSLAVLIEKPMKDENEKSCKSSLYSNS